MRYLKFALALACGLFAAQRGAEAAVRISIDLSTQRMHVVNGKGESATWAVSTARSGYRTPRGTFRPYALHRMHYSRKYNMSPMPHSIFFLGGYAIHGTGALSQLGRPASHGLYPSCAGQRRETVRHGAAGRRSHLDHRLASRQYDVCQSEAQQGDAAGGAQATGQSAGLCASAAHAVSEGVAAQSGAVDSPDRHGRP